MKNDTRRAYLELHLAVLLFGLTAILGDLIALSALAIVWWRLLLTTGSLLLLVRWRTLWRSVPGKIRRRYMGIGVLVALQWLTFYGAIKLSNASIALVALATTSFFTAFAEPLLLRQPFRPLDIALGLLIVPGMILIVDNTEWSMMAGLGVGLLSALIAAFFTALNKKYIATSNALHVTLLELGSAWVLLSCALPVIWLADPGVMEAFRPAGRDWLYLIVLSLLCTTLAYVLALRALRYLSAFAANLTINLEPVYGVTLAWLLLQDNEELRPGFYLGVAIILAAVFVHPLLRRRERGVTG